MALKIDQYNPIYNDSGDRSTSNDEKKKDPDNEKDTEKEQKKPQKRKSNKLFNFFKDNRVKGVIGIALLLFAALLLISCVSFLVHGADDQSMVSNRGILENAKSSGIKNDGGPFGAAAANFLFNQGFGIGSFFLIFLIAAIGLHLLGYYKARIVSTIVICLTATITVSSVIGLVTLEDQTFLLLGGNHGYYLNTFLWSVIGIYGTIFVNLFLICVLTALCINSLKRIYTSFAEFRAKRKVAQLEAKRIEDAERKHTFGEPEEEDSSNDVDTKKKRANKKEKIAFNQIEENAADDEQDTELFGSMPSPAEPTATETDTESQSKYMPTTAMTATASGKEAEAVTLEIQQPQEIEKADKIEQRPFDPTAELSKFKFPPSSLLNESKNDKPSIDITEQEENKARITKTLGDYGIDIKSIKVCVGPTITLYEIIPAEGVRIAKIKGLEDDIAMSLAALGIRIIAPIPGKGTIGIEVPNRDKQTVSMRSVIESKKFQECDYKLPIALGCTISNDVFIADLTKMPHILVAGATGMGKSVGLNAIITSLLYKKHPSELKFVMIDPKMVEFSIYAPLEYHYIAQMEGEEDAIITNMNKAVATLNSLVKEMEDRLQLLFDAKERNIQDYNRKFINHRLNPEKGHRFLPYIVVIIDELADLIMNIGRKEVETPIARITQKARAIGIHMIIATQRPSTDIITGVIKANCPGRIAFRVTQMVDSRTILDRSGAQQLIGRGDMLITYDNQLTRVQCAFVDTPEVEAIVDYISEQPGFDQPYELPEYTPESANNSGGSDGGEYGNQNERDPLFKEAAEFIIEGRTASTSSLQRRYSIGYNRAGKIMDQMEAAGIVGPSVGGKPRQVLIDSYQLESILNQNQE